MIWLDSLIAGRVVDNPQTSKSSPEILLSAAPEPIITMAYQAARVSAMPTYTGTKGFSGQTENSYQLVGRPRSQIVDPHEALESLDKLRIYQARVAAALEKKKYAEAQNL